MKKIFFIGDIVGRVGRNIVKEVVPKFREKHGIDIVIANAENAAGGAGLTSSTANEILGCEVDGLTLGNHIWDQRGFAEEIDKLDKVCRPANLPEQCPGRKYLIIEKDGFRLGVFTMLGRIFMKPAAECPFKHADQMLEELDGKVDAILAEIHAETTSEKGAFARYLDGRVAMVVGTHTHIPTADDCILERGTAFMTDVGMTGPYDSVLGVEKGIIIKCLLDGMPRRFEVAEGDVRLYGCIATVDEKEGYTTKFEPVCIKEGEFGDE